MLKVPFLELLIAMSVYKTRGIYGIFSQFCLTAPRGFRQFTQAGAARPAFREAGLPVFFCGAWRASLLHGPFAFAENFARTNGILVLTGPLDVWLN